PMNYRALFAMIKMADRIGQTDPEHLAAMLSLFPKTLHLPPSLLEFLSKLQVRAKANSRQRQIGSRASTSVARKPAPLNNPLERHRTRARMNDDLMREEFASGSQG